MYLIINNTSWNSVILPWVDFIWSVKVYAFLCPLISKTNFYSLHSWMGSHYQLFCSRLLETVKEQCLVVWLKLLLDHPTRKNTRSTTHLLSLLSMLLGIGCFILQHVDFFFILLALNFPQGTNNSFVFTDTSGCPVIYRPTGIFHRVWVCHFFIFCHYGYTVLCLVSKSIIDLWMTKSRNERFDFCSKIWFGSL